MFCVERLKPQPKADCQSENFGRVLTTAYRHKQSFRLYHPSVCFRAHTSRSRVVSFGDHCESVSGKYWPLVACQNIDD